MAVVGMILDTGEVDIDALNALGTPTSTEIIFSAKDGFPLYLSDYIKGTEVSITLAWFGAQAGGTEWRPISDTGGNASVTYSASFSGNKKGFALGMFGRMDKIKITLTASGTLSGTITVGGRGELTK